MSDIYTTVLKVPGFECMEENREIDPHMYQQLIKVHQFECDFYNKLAKTLDLPVPKIHKTLPWIINETNGAIHMEDLSRNCKVIELSDGLNTSQIMDITQYLAKIHMKMMNRDDWHGKYLDNQTTLKTMGEMVADMVEPCLSYCNQSDKGTELIDSYILTNLYIEF